MVGAYCLLAPKSSRHLEPGLMNSMSAVPKLRARSGRSTIPLVLLACAALLPGCGGNSNAEKSQQVDLSAFGPAIAGISGNRVFVWGGRSVENPAGENLATGEILSLPVGTRSAVPPAPFNQPVALPRAAASGDRVLVVGESCPKWSDVDLDRSCDPGSLVGAIYNAKSQTWVPVDFAPGVAEALHTVTRVEASDQGVALVSSRAQPDVLIVVDLASAKARRLPSPPLGQPSAGQAVADATACLSGSSVVVVERTAPPGFIDGRTVGPAHSYVASVAAESWRTLAGPPGISDPVVTCGNDGVLVSNGIGVNLGIVWLNLTTEAWQDVQPPDGGGGGGPETFGVRTRSGDDLILLHGTPGSAVMRLNPPTSNWTPLEASPRSFECDWGQCITVTDSYLVGADRVLDNKVSRTVVFWTAA